MTKYKSTNFNREISSRTSVYVFLTHCLLMITLKSLLVAIQSKTNVALGLEFLQNRLVKKIV